MNESDSLGIGLVRRMATSAVPVPTPEQAGEQRIVVVARMRELQRQAQQRKQRTAKWRRSLVWVAAAVLPALAVGSAWYASRSPSAAPTVAVSESPARVETAAPGVQIVHSAAPVDIAVSKSAALRAGDTVITAAQGPAEVSMPSGATLLVAPSTRLSVDWDPAGGATHERITLSAGVTDVSVPKLVAGGSFSVTTPDAEVVVHGTRFTVRVYERTPGVWLTDVRVTEGHVSVRHAADMAMLSPGQTWTTARGKDEPAAGLTPPASASGPASEAKLDTPAPAASPAERRAPPSNTLAEENALFESALTASRAGDDAGAISLFDRLLSEYPSSPLAGMARRERVRAQQRLEERRNGATR